MGGSTLSGVQRGRQARAALLLRRAKEDGRILGRRPNPSAEGRRVRQGTSERTGRRGAR